MKRPFKPSFTCSRELDVIEHQLKDYATPFSCLEAYWMGYEEGYAGRHYERSEADFIAPHGFHQFVTERLGHSWPSPKGWRIRIREHTTSEREAFEMFFRFRREFEAQHAKAA